MQVFITGASGHIGSLLIPELLSAGHGVTGLARSAAAAGAIRSLGAQVRRGDLADLDGLRAAAAEADGVVHLGFDHDRQQAGDLAGAVAADLAAVGALGEGLVGSGKPFVSTNATGGMALAGWSGVLTESDTLPGGPRVDAENAVAGLAGRDVRATVVRLPPAVHSDGRYGFVSGLLDIARRSGVSGYVGDGANRWASVDTHDVARLYRLALESGQAGSRVHAVAEEGITMRTIAETIGDLVGVPAVAVAPDEVGSHFGYLAPFVGLDNPVSSTRTQAGLDWHPTQPGLLTALRGDPTLRGS